MHGFGKALLASLFASGSLAAPWAQGVTPDSTSVKQDIKKREPGAKVAEVEPLPQISDVGPAYSLLLAKEISPIDLDGVVVAWAYGIPFCTQRQLLSESIEDFCNKNLTFDRVPKLDENLQATGQVTQISGYFAGCSDDVSLGRSYAGLYWVEVVGMYDGVGDQPASPGGSDTYVQRPTAPKSDAPPPTTKDTPTTPKDSPDSTAYKCNNDRESHECPRGNNNDQVEIIVFASCGQYAYTDKKGAPGTGGAAGGSTTTPP